MTTATRVLRDAQLLYLAVDLGEAPTFSRYSDQIEAVNKLLQYCATLVAATPDVPPRTADFDPSGSYSAYADIEPRERSSIVVVRTSLSSPWVSVLGELAKSSQPVAYGVGTLYAIHRLMQMIMDWQKHRQDLAERKSAAEVSSIARLLGDHQRDTSLLRPDQEQFNRAAPAVQQLDTIIATEMITPDDPRAIGQG